MATPDTDTGTNQIVNQQSNILDEHSNNVISNIELNENHSPVTSVCDNIGLHVSKQIKGKIIKEEYVELEKKTYYLFLCQIQTCKTLGQDTLLWAKKAILNCSQKMSKR